MLPETQSQQSINILLSKFYLDFNGIERRQYQMENLKVNFSFYCPLVTLARIEMPSVLNQPRDFVKIKAKITLINGIEQRTKFQIKCRLVLKSVQFLQKGWQLCCICCVFASALDCMSVTQGLPLSLKVTHTEYTISSAALRSK